MAGDPNQSIERLQSFDWDQLENVEGDAACWFSEAKEKLKCKHEREMTAEKFMVLTKSVMSNWLATAADVMSNQTDMMLELKEQVELLKTEALADKSRVIKLQAELLERKDDQLKSLQIAVQSTVQSTVHDTVQTEIRTYGDALKKPSVAAAISPAAFKKIVKTVIKEEDRTKNLMVFGLAEEDGEHLDEKISDVFQGMGEKPRAASARVGNRSVGGSGCRPVKVTLSSSTAVWQILTNSRKLRQLEKFKSVYVSPDRSPAEQAERKQLVLNMKEKMTAQPGHYHYIRSGRVLSSIMKTNT